MRNAPALHVTFVGLAALCGSIEANAAIYRVGSDSGCTHTTIQAAINSARASAEADDIRLASASVAEANLLINDSGTLTVSGGYASCLASAPVAGQRTVVLGVGTMPVLRVRNTRTLVLANLDLQRGNASRGGGIDVQGAPTGSQVNVVVLSNTLVRGNQATLGGGVSIVNTSATSTPNNLQILLFGGSAVLDNRARTSGGGIDCTRAKVMLFDRSHVGLNTAEDGKGGGVLARDCEVVIGTRGFNGAVFWSNTASGTGGAMHIEGPLARADIFTIDADVPARITGNSAIAGGAISATGSARIGLFDAVLEQNDATAYGGALLISHDATPGQTRLRMQRGGTEAPPAAVRCADTEACNLIRANRVVSGAGDLGRAGSAMVAFSSTADAVRADFLGTRFDFNDGTTLAYLGGNHADAVFVGALMVNNIATDALIKSEGSPRTLDVSSSTIANNSIAVGNAVIRATAVCTSLDGTRVRNSIIWQPQRALIAPIGLLDPACFRHLISADFGALPAAVDRVPADPLFLDAAGGNFHVYTASPAIDFAPARPDDATRDGRPRVVDSLERIDLFGPQDAGAYERYSERLFKNGFDCEEC